MAKEHIMDTFPAQKFKNQELNEIINNLKKKIKYSNSFVIRWMLIFQYKLDNEKDNDFIYILTTENEIYNKEKNINYYKNRIIENFDISKEYDEILKLDERLNNFVFAKIKTKKEKKKKKKKKIILVLSYN